MNVRQRHKRPRLLWHVFDNGVLGFGCWFFIALCFGYAFNGMELSVRVLAITLALALTAGAIWGLILGIALPAILSKLHIARDAD